jgi:hypothetical protein
VKNFFHNFFVFCFVRVPLFLVATLSRLRATFRRLGEGGGTEAASTIFLSLGSSHELSNEMTPRLRQTAS